jgi:hypothetical protein
LAAGKQKQTYLHCLSISLPLDNGLPQASALESFPMYVSFKIPEQSTFISSVFNAEGFRKLDVQSVEHVFSLSG